MELPSGAHAGAPCRSSAVDTMRGSDPSVCITYNNDWPPCRTENAIDRPSGESAGPPKICASFPLHNSVAVVLASFQMLSPVPVAEMYIRKSLPNLGEDP